MELEEAVSTYVESGDLVGIGGLSFWRKPISIVREIIRQRSSLNDLTICTFVGGIEVDMLIGAKIVSEVRSSFTGMEVFGMAPNYRKAIEEGKIKVREETEATIAHGLKASYLKVPFMPLRGIIGTDFPKVRDDLVRLKDPLGSDIEVMALPKIDLDVAILHVPFADELGNANIPGSVWMDADMAKTAKKTIITCEKIVETEDIIHTERKAQLPMQTTDAVIRVPFGAHPTSCYPNYTFDPLHIQEYLNYNFNDYFEKYIQNSDQIEYLEKTGGIKTIFNILL
jgi:glutaconate CoA-transferase subunit A